MRPDTLPDRPFSCGRRSNVKRLLKRSKYKSIDRAGDAIVRETRLRAIGSARRERKRRWGRDRDNEIYPVGLPVTGRGYAAHRSRINLEFGEIALHRHRRILQIVLHLHINSAGPVGNKLRNGDRSQETDDRHYQEQLDQRETSDRFIDARRHAYPGWSCFYEL